jgi:hypothetical protein
MRNIITFMLEKIESRMRDIFISLKEIEFRNVEMLLYFLKNQLLTKVRFSNVCNRIHNCQNVDFERIKNKKSIFSKT